MSKLSSIKRHLTFANVASGLALFIAIGGGTALAITLPANSVKSRTIKNRNVKNADIATAAVSNSKLRTGAVTQTKIADGAVSDDKLQGTYQFGDGTSAGSALNGVADGADIFAGITLNNGTADLVCAANPHLDYQDFAGDAYTTEEWDSSLAAAGATAHSTIADGGTTSLIFSPNQTQVIQFGGFGTDVITVTVDRNGDNTCDAALEVHSNGFQ